MKSVVITGAGIVSSLGDTPAGLHAALCEGLSGLRPADLFDQSGLGCPLDRTSRLVASAAQLALDASGWTAEMRAGQEVGLVLGTMFCSVHTISEFDRRALEAGPADRKSVV